MHSAIGVASVANLFSNLSATSPWSASLERSKHAFVAPRPLRFQSRQLSRVVKSRSYVACVSATPGYTDPKSNRSRPGFFPRIRKSSVVRLASVAWLRPPATRIVGCLFYDEFARRSPVAKVKKILFGEPDPEENKKFIDFHLQEEYNRGCLKWNFNFREETTLDPKGDYIWQPSSPILINRKRKPVEVIDDSRAYYFQPIEPVARSPENQPKIKVPKQTRITESKITVGNTPYQYIIDSSTPEHLSYLLSQSQLLVLYLHVANKL
ncbi:hypothetical protein GEV33_004985 [Tenebrio molitor]|uniref:Cyclin-dependent kinase inhibitor domain-containing protein n=1 Tax=Tenebrio molitor TaxID=7067 RepID=A0A8J6LM68_TENMO|nr:hypothetical protein GEV33_004985 [Tenebrio molitor]